MLTSRYPCFARLNAALYNIGKLQQSSGTLVLVGHVLTELLFNFYILEILTLILTIGVNVAIEINRVFPQYTNLATLAFFV